MDRPQHPDDFLLNRTPALQGYIERVGAVQKSFRRFVIEGAPEYSAVRKALAVITIASNGALTISGDVEGPTETEADAIALEVVAAKWPQSVGAGRVPLPELLKHVDRNSLFEFKSRDGTSTLFLQERREVAAGKIYVPWSFWDDQRWRQMEPDGPLPLFGLDRLANNSIAFIHEGAKAARHCAWMAASLLWEAREALSRHPWGDHLSHAVHLGWAGGAQNPHRTDWSVLKQAGISHIYIVADNDQAGLAAVSKISKLTLLPATAVVFDDRFPVGFDLADDWPNEKQQPKWWNGTRYIGPSFHEMCHPATYATIKIETGEPGRPRISLRKDFVGEWAVSKEPHLFVHRHFPHQLLTPDVFNRTIAPFADTDNVARLLVKHLQVHADGITYRPHLPAERALIINVDGKRLINTYRPPNIKPIRGDNGKPFPDEARPFLDFMEYLIPDHKDRHEVLRWCATLIARPDIRMRYALLLISEKQGVGKTTLSDAILKPLVGAWNTSSPSEQQVTEGGFNTWIAHKRLATINEIYSGERRKSYDRLKGAISDDFVWVNRKFVEEYEIENFLHIVACSNSIKALHLDDADRRFLVPAVTEELHRKEWWDNFYCWLNGGGLSAIAAWAEDFTRNHGPVSTGDRAPDTTRKREIIAASRSEGAQLAYDLARAIIETGKDVVLRLDDVHDWNARMRGLQAGDSKLERKLTLRKALMEGGMLRPERRPGSDGRVTIHGRPVEIVGTFKIEQGATWEDKGDKPGLKTYWRKASDFMDPAI